jgi:hypothetical protein
MAGPWEAYAPTAPAEAGPWDAFRTGGGTDQPADPARAETRAANGTFRGMLSGAQRAVEQGYTLGFRDEAQATLDGAVHSGIAGVRNLLHGQAPAFGAAGAGTGLALHGGLALGGRILRPVRNALTAEEQALVDTARNENIPLSLAQQTGSRTLKNAEAALAQLPGSSAGTDAITSAAGSEMGRRQALAAALEQQPPQPEGMTAAQRAALARQLDR